MAAPLNDPAKQAAANLDSALAVNSGFPENVFRGRWDGFFFFDQDSLFRGTFTEKIKALLALENAAVVCMRNLDITETAESAEQASVFLDRETTAEAHMAFLRAPAVGLGWLYLMFRYACISDGRWCISCERNNEIAVIAVRGNFDPAIEQLGAMPIDKAIENPPSWGLTSRGLPVEWRDKLLKEYSS